jgi:hypothetical protein
MPASRGGLYSGYVTQEVYDVRGEYSHILILGMTRSGVGCRWGMEILWYKVVGMCRIDDVVCPTVSIIIA